MNLLFAAVFLCSAACALFLCPEGFLPALLEGGEKAAVLTLSLLASYCVWLGFFRVMEDSGLSAKLARLSAPLTRKLFRTHDSAAASYVSGNLTANLLGLPGAPTPLGVKAAARLLETGNTQGADMLFVLNATSLQLLPTTVISLRLAAGSSSPADILLPTLIATIVSTAAGILLLKLAGRR